MPLEFKIDWNFQNLFNHVKNHIRSADRPISFLLMENVIHSNMTKEDERKIILKEMDDKLQIDSKILDLLELEISESAQSIVGTNRFSWEIDVNAPTNLFSEITKIEYTLPPNFTNRKQTKNNDNNSFKINGSAWYGFMVKAEIISKNISITKYKWIKP